MGGTTQNMTTNEAATLQTSKLKPHTKSGFQNGMNVGPSVRHNGKHVVISYYDMNVYDNEASVQFGWKYSERNNDNDGSKPCRLYPASSYHFEAKKRFSLIRPLQWFLYSIVKNIKPHRSTNCERWKSGDKISKKLLNSALGGCAIKLNAMN